MAKEKTVRKDYGVSPAEFVEIWQSSQSTGEVVKRTGMPKRSVNARASTYRKKGVKLKEHEVTSKRRFDIDELNRLAEEAAKGEAAIETEVVLPIIPKPIGSSYRSPVVEYLTISTTFGRAKPVKRAGSPGGNRSQGE